MTTAAALLSAAAVRERCGIVHAAAERGETRHFRLMPGQLDAVAERVAAVTRRRYPDLAVPFHSRWRHFAAGGVERAGEMAPGADRDEAARARLDLAVVSVLLDAGAGPQWSYREAETGLALSRSEGLGVASLRAMQAGLFSSDPASPWRADAAVLCELTEEALGRAFQTGSGNELAGLAGRAALLRALGRAIVAMPEVFGRPARPGNIYDHWLPQRDGLAASDMLGLILRAFGAIWPGRLVHDGVPLGDCGRHDSVPGDGLVPFHKLSQWMVYSLVEPLIEAGFTGLDLDGLTGLAEYRNGGLFLDGGVLVPRDSDLARRPLDPFDEAVVEWRALSVILLDRLAPRVREILGKDASVFPLSCMLEGGSWAAGRELAAEARAGGGPPLNIVSDGTLFFEDDPMLQVPLTIVEHPLVRHKLSLMRDVATSTAKFRRLMHEISVLVAYEVTRDLPLEQVEIETPLERANFPVLSGKKLCLVSILRAGDGILGGMLELLPSARVGHIGLYRDPATLAAIEYYLKLPADLPERDAILVDPMLATGNSAVAAISRLKEMQARSIKFVCLVAAPEGVAHVHKVFPDVPIIAAALDRELNAHGYILPGLGDAGDRLFGTR